MLDCSDKIRTVACDEKFNSEVFMETNYKTDIFDYPLRMKMSFGFVKNLNDKTLLILDEPETHLHPQ